MSNDDELQQPAASGPQEPHVRKPWRHRYHDYQPIDEVRIVTVPRYKQSGLSGDEWRTSGKIQYLRKGRVIHEKDCRDVDSALRYGDWWLCEFLERGNYSAGRADDDCDQEGCSEKATVTYRLRHRYTRQHGQRIEGFGMVHIVRFCERHRHRGDCGIEDSDSNYEEVILNPDGTISELPGSK